MASTTTIEMSGEAFKSEQKASFQAKVDLRPVLRTFSWFGRNRRLAKDFENLAETLLA